MPRSVNTAIVLRIKTEQDDFFEYILERNNDLEISEVHEKRTILMYLANRGNTKMLEMFRNFVKKNYGEREFKKQVNLADHRGNNCLMLSCLSVRPLQVHIAMIMKYTKK